MAAMVLSSLQQLAVEATSYLLDAFEAWGSQTCSTVCTVLNVGAGPCRRSGGTEEVNGAQVAFAAS